MPAALLHRTRYEAFIANAQRRATGRKHLQNLSCDRCTNVHHVASRGPAAFSDYHHLTATCNECEVEFALACSQMNPVIYDILGLIPKCQHFRGQDGHMLVWIDNAPYKVYERSDVERLRRDFPHAA